MRGAALIEFALWGRDGVGVVVETEMVVVFVGAVVWMVWMRVESGDECAEDERTNGRMIRGSWSHFFRGADVIASRVWFASLFWSR